MENKGLLAVFLAAVMVFSGVAFAEEAILQEHGDSDRNATEAIGHGDKAKDKNETNDETDSAEIEIEKVQPSEGRAIGREDEPEEDAAEDNVAAVPITQDTVSAEPVDYSTILAEIGAGLSAKDAKNLGEIMSALAHRAKQARQGQELTGKERAEFNKQLNAYLKDMRADLRLAVKDKNLSQVVARELERRANAAAKAKNPAELSPEQIVGDISAALGITGQAGQAQLKDLFSEQIRNRIHFWNRFLERLKNNAQFRQHFKDWVHRQVAKQKAKLVQPEAVLENPAAKAVDHRFVREHLLEKIRQRLRDRAHNAKQSAANPSVVPQIVQDMRNANAVIDPAVVQVDSAAVAVEVNPAAEVTPAVAQPQ